MHCCAQPCVAGQRSMLWAAQVQGGCLEDLFIYIYIQYYIIILNCVVFLWNNMHYYNIVHLLFYITNNITYQVILNNWLQYIYIYIYNIILYYVILNNCILHLLYCIIFCYIALCYIILLYATLCQIILYILCFIMFSKIRLYFIITMFYNYSIFLYTFIWTWWGDHGSLDKLYCVYLPL